MGKKNKYSVKTSEFHDYFEGKLSNRERNAFERKMQKDLFNADAAEGYAMISREEAEEDLNNAGKKIRRRINLRRRVGWYSAAATLAAVLTITTIFLTVDQTPNDQDDRIRKMTKDLDKTVIEEEVSNVPGEEERIVSEEPQVAGTIEEGATEDPVGMEDREEIAGEDVSEDKGGGAADTDIGPGIVEDDMADDMALEVEEDQAGIYEFAMEMDDEEVSDAVVMNYEEAEVSMKKEEAIAREVVQVTATGTEKSSRAATMKRKAAVTEDLDQVSGVPVSLSAPKSTTIQIAVPVNGMTAYMQYVDSTLVFPKAELSRSSAVVDLKFYIMTDGRPDNIQVLSSPSQAFSDEAQSVITNGPAWTPASSEGLYNNSELEMRIEFKESHKR